MSRVEVDPARPCDAGAPGPSRPGPPGRAVGRLLRARPRAGIAASGGRHRDLGNGRGQPAAVCRRGVPSPRPPRPAHSGPTARTARSRGAPDDRPGPHLRWPRALVLGTAAARRCPRNTTPRPFRRGQSGRHRARRPGRTGPSEHRVPGAARPDLGPRTARADRPWGSARAAVHGRRGRATRARGGGPGRPGRTPRRGRARPDRRRSAGRPRSSGGPRPPRRGDGLPDPPTRCPGFAADRTTGRSSSPTRTTWSDRDRGATRTGPSSSSGSGRPRLPSRS